MKKFWRLLPVTSFILELDLASFKYLLSESFQWWVYPVLPLVFSSAWLSLILQDTTASMSSTLAPAFAVLSDLMEVLGNTSCKFVVFVRQSLHNCSLDWKKKSLVYLSCPWDLTNLLLPNAWLLHTKYIYFRLNWGYLREPELNSPHVWLTKEVIGILLLWIGWTFSSNQQTWFLFFYGLLQLLLVWLAQNFF